MKSNRFQDNIEVQAIESTTVTPLFENLSPGVRTYTLCDWDDIGIEAQAITGSSIDIMGAFENQTIYAPGLAPYIPLIFVAIRDFNPDDRERQIEEKGGGVRVLAFRTGELII